MKWIDRILQREDIKQYGCPPYLIRWTLFSLPNGVRIYVHKFLADDWARDPHDHPKRFISIGIRGSYFERRYTKDGSEYRKDHYRAPWIRTFPANHIHRICGVKNPTWTVVIALISVRVWGFIKEGKWVRWDKYIIGSKVEC